MMQRDILDILSEEQLTPEEQEMLAGAMLGHGNRKKAEEATGLAPRQLYSARDQKGKDRNLDYGTLVKVRKFLHSLTEQEA